MSMGSHRAVTRTSTLAACGRGAEALQLAYSHVSEIVTHAHVLVSSQGFEEPVQAGEGLVSELRAQLALDGSSGLSLGGEVVDGPRGEGDDLFPAVRR
jgi:hypothetical protein